MIHLHVGDRAQECVEIQAYRRTSAAAGPSAELAVGQFDQCPGWSPGRCDRLSRPGDHEWLIVVFADWFFVSTEFSRYCRLRVEVQ